MKNWKIITLTTLAVVAAALLVSTVVAMGPVAYNPNTGYGGMMGRSGSGMMGGYGYGYGQNSPPYTSQPGTTPSTQYYQPVYPSMFGGMMGRMFNGFGGMMKGYGYGAPYTYTGTTLTIADANTIAQKYVTSIGNTNLVVKQVEEYTNNFYVQVNDKSTGNGAFELLINKLTGSIYPEMGPNMMWNTQYGMMRGGILGGIYGPSTTTLSVTISQATTDAQQYLTAYLPSTTTGDVTAFPGYYTIEIVNGTTPYGMLSVNGYSGQVWYHTWHGAFIQELQVS
jgi:Flp pilus assembly protein TadG